MPTYEFLHRTEECQHEWEDFMSITAPDPTTCPKCNKEGNIIRLISGGSGKGKVELYGQDLVDSVKSDAIKIQKEAYNNENLYSNLLGPDKYNKLQTQYDRRPKRK